MDLLPAKAVCRFSVKSRVSISYKVENSISYLRKSIMTSAVSETFEQELIQKPILFVH